MSDRSGLPRAIRLRPGPPGTPAGDLIDGRSAASALLRPPGPDSDIELEHRSQVSAAPFTPTTDRARGKLSAILAGDGVLVTTGQQPGLFLGPLYVVYKILSAVSQARRIEEATGKPALASFWIAADDHDWEEVGSARIVDRGGEIESLRIRPGPGDAGRAVGTANLGDDVLSLLDRFADAAGASEFSDAALAPLHTAYRPGASVAGAFRSAFLEMLGGFDLVFFDPTHAEVRRKGTPFIGNVIEHSAGVSEALDAGTAAVAAAGYEQRLRPPGQGTQVFYDDGSARSHLLREGAGLRNGRSGELRRVEDWLEQLEAEPGRFSAAAALRPALESWLLPVARTVLGPGEMAYWAQLGPLFERLDVEMPETALRSSWLLVEPRVERWLAGLGASVRDLEDGGAQVERRITRESRPQALDQSIERLRAGIERDMGALEGISDSEFPGLSAAFGKARKSMEDTVGSLERTIDGRVRDARKTRLARARRAANLLYPDGQPQERVDSPFSFLARYGPSFLTGLALIHDIEPERGHG